MSILVFTSSVTSGFVLTRLGYGGIQAPLRLTEGVDVEDAEEAVGLLSGGGACEAEFLPVSGILPALSTGAAFPEVARVNMRECREKHLEM